MFFLLLLLALVVKTICDRNCSYVDSLVIENPAYTKVVKSEETGTNVLYVSSFSDEEGDHGKFFVIKHLFNHLSPGMFRKLEIEEATSDAQFIWPNSISSCSSKTCGEQGIFNSNGFLIPGKSTGNVYYLPLDTDYGVSSKAYPLFKPMDEYFYHQTSIFDLFGDGEEEVILTARVKVDLETLEGTGEMLVLKGPLYDKSTSSFIPPKILFSFPGPQTVFDIVRDPKDPKIVYIIASQFFSSQLILYSSNDWKSQRYNTTIVDVGQAFDARLLDINGDGNLDIIASMQKLGNWGYLYSYHLDVTSNTWERHLISGPFTHAHGMSNGAPGMIDTIYLDTEEDNDKPWFVLGGDDGGSFFLIHPKDGDKKNWEYETTMLYQTEHTVAQVEVFYDEDTPYLLLNDYTQNKILLYVCK